MATMTLPAKQFNEASDNRVNLRETRYVEFMSRNTSNNNTNVRNRTFPAVFQRRDAGVSPNRKIAPKDMTILSPDKTAVPADTKEQSAGKVILTFDSIGLLPDKITMSASTASVSISQSYFPAGKHSLPRDL